MPGLVAGHVSFNGAGCCYQRLKELTTKALEEAAPDLAC
jgi:hypothetical protein